MSEEAPNEVQDNPGPMSRPSQRQASSPQQSTMHGVPHQPTDRMPWSSANSLNSSARLLPVVFGKQFLIFKLVSPGEKKGRVRR